MKSDLEESVLVVERAIIDPLCRLRFSREPEKIRAAVLPHCSFLERTVAEHDFRYKQIIPYVLVRHEAEYLLVRRTKKQTEKRLHDMYSLGVGGHINKDDVSNGNNDLITSGMRRELAEEIQIEGETACELIGVIDDDSTEVARVHLGFVYLLTAASRRFTIMESGKFTANWALPDAITPYYNQMESWAQIVHDYVLFNGAPERIRRWEVRR